MSGFPTALAICRPTELTTVRAAPESYNARTRKPPIPIWSHQRENCSVSTVSRGSHGNPTSVSPSGSIGTTGVRAGLRTSCADVCEFSIPEILSQEIGAVGTLSIRPLPRFPSTRDRWTLRSRASRTRNNILLHVGRPRYLDCDFARAVLWAFAPLYRCHRSPRQW